MDDLVRELRLLNETLRRIAGMISPQITPDTFSASKAFRVYTQNSRLAVKTIASPDPVTFRELMGIGHVTAALRTNTEQFLSGLPCSNVLVYGPRGTGKSSSVKALLNEYGRKGLKMVEVTKESLLRLPELAEILRQRDEKFIIFCDDLSFEQDDSSYIPVKAVLEGGLEARPVNMLIYATSNRRHLMPERTEDNLPEYSGGELHPSETLEEKTSLSDRFGLRLGTTHFDLTAYMEIVSNYALIRKIRIRKEELKDMAVQWAHEHGNYSGRTARQFIDNLQGRLGLEKK